MTSLFNIETWARVLNEEQKGKKDCILKINLDASSLSTEHVNAEFLAAALLQCEASPIHFPSTLQYVKLFLPAAKRSAKSRQCLQLFTYALGTSV